MTHNQRRALLTLTTAVMASLALLFGVMVGEGIASTDAAVSAGDASTTTAAPTTIVDATTTTMAPATTQPPTTAPTPPPTTAPPMPEPAPNPVPVDCDLPAHQGERAVPASGIGAGPALGIEPFLGSCSGVLVRFEGESPPANVFRDPGSGVTVLRFATDHRPTGPIDDLVDFADEARLSLGLHVYEDDWFEVVLYHPAHIDDLGVIAEPVEGGIALAVRERRDSDPMPVPVPLPTPSDRYDARGPFEHRLVVDRVSVDGVGDSVSVHGYADVPTWAEEIIVQIRDVDSDTTHCTGSDVPIGPDDQLSGFDLECSAPPGTHDLWVGWVGDAPDGSEDVWHVETIEIDG
ncbi:MAG: hypothetical protein OSA99_05530 [Acidimicrobiales bacterium]|nr:hypothetical protein [Acidimicrobiales bacterium]